MRKTFIRLGRHGRLMKEDNFGMGGGGAGGSTPAGGGDNNAGNSNESSSSGNESNNNGQTFDANAFWGSSEGGNGSDPSGESAQNGSGNESGSSGPSLQDTLTSRLESMTFGDPVFTAEITQQINEGNFEGVEGRIQAQMRSAVQNSLAMVVQILKPFSEQMTNQMRAEMQQTFSTRDNSASLETLFPAAKNPAVRPMIDSIFTQALKNTKGNREEAVRQTKEMLRFAAGATAGDLDISVAPRGPDDSGRPAPTIDWLDELTSR